MKHILTLLALCALSCDPEPDSSLTWEATDNARIPVSKVFTHKGCTVYRFVDADLPGLNGRYEYYVNCK